LRTSRHATTLMTAATTSEITVMMISAILVTST
jgi:hypothetical protein